MGLLDTETFELWMSKIMERFDRYEQMLSKLAGKEIKEVKYLANVFWTIRTCANFFKRANGRCNATAVPGRCATRCYGIKSTTRNRTCRSS